MILQREKIDLGIEKPIRILHLSDTHICEADERDDERKCRLAETRHKVFEKEPGDCIRYFDEALAYGKENSDLIVHTGDLIDFVSVRNIEIMAEKLKGTNTFMAAGNHEFSLYVGEALEDTAYKMQSFDKIEAVAPNPLAFASHILGGVNFVSVDDSYYLFTSEQLEALQKEVEKGLPIVLMMHNPIHTDDLYNYQMHDRKSQCAFLTGTPDELLAAYNEKRRAQHKPDAPTLEFIDYVKNQPLIKLILAGHLHFNYKTYVTPTLPQIVTGGGFDGLATELEIV